MKLSSVVMVLLTSVLIRELTEALNVTVTPGPVSLCLEGENITVSCLVSQKKWSSSLLVLRWLYFPKPEDERLVVKMNFKKAMYYGNYSLSFSQTKFYLWEEMEGEVYSLLILNVSREDRGIYSCKVQEIRKHRNKWRASSNGTGSMELRVHYLGVPESTDNIWRWFQAPVPHKPRRTKLLKVQPRKSHMPRVADDSLTYAELELVKRAPEAKRSSLGTAQLETNANCTGTVYAQILFVEKQV
ncbi:V-set and transmembrane domain-containing protein 4 [Bagarius yarrelli]|uniref:V-set and transmembrane domain-containing protein 4 n=1 Tax=Bagarius yarrelli TaxID=175774 RepID=A0A556TN33_BAGYA|nr:V-set and transmembrane domain-containing protein 4 [Bagarius yarrelli]